MAKIKTYRVDGNRVKKDEPEFYFKLCNENDLKLMNLAIGGDGLYYYKPGSQILTPKENNKTLNTYDGYLTMEQVKALFESLRKIGWSRNKEDNQNIKINVEKKKIVIEVVEE